MCCSKDMFYHCHLLCGLTFFIMCLFQNADDGTGERRSRRSRKDVNYAELNDIYLPPLGPQDLVGNHAIPATAVPGTRSRMRRNDVYIQEDYLAPRVRSTSARRRWREIDSEIEEESRLDESVGENMNSADSPDDRRGNLKVTVEEDESEVKSSTPDSIQSDPLSWHPVETVRKKPRFACLENDDLSPIDVLLQQSSAPPLPYFNLSSLPAPPLTDSLLFGSDLAPSSKQCVGVAPGNHYMTLPSNLSGPNLHCEENLEEGAQTVVAVQPSLLTVDCSAETKNLSQEQ